MPKVWLIRHGQSAANAGRRTDAPDAIPLTELGEAQARAIAADLERPPKLIVTSPLLRAQQTARATKVRFPQVPSETWPVHEFAFLSPAHCHGTNRSERWPMVVEYWRRADPHHVDGDGAESYAAFATRAKNTLDRLTNEHRTPVAIFAHEQLILRILWELMVEPAAADSADMLAFARFHDRVQIANGARVELTRDGDRWMWHITAAPQIPRR